MPTSLRRAAVLAALLAAGTAAPAADNAIPHSAVSGGGSGVSSSPSYDLLAIVGQAVAGSTAAASATYRFGAGYSQAAHFPGTVVGLAARGDVSASSATLVWNSPGYDGSLGALSPGTTYFVRVASYTVPDTFSDHRLANV